MSLGNSVPTHVGPPRTTTSLTTIFNGTAKVIQKTATMSFALRPDPVKSIMAQEIVNEEKIIVITPVVTGGGAQITPERAAAKVVSTTATAREFTLARYGLDVIMNLNGAHQPDVFAEELNTKLSAQRKQMDEAWIGLTYEAIMNEGVSIVQAMLRSNPVHGVKSSKARRLAADRIYANLFACMDKDDYPIPNMISALSYAAVNTPVDGAPDAGAVLLVPPGTFTTSKYTRPAEMNFNLSGIPLKDNESSLAVPLTNVRSDNEYNLRILTHFPPADYTSYDSENPQVKHNELMREVGIATYYPLSEKADEIHVTNFRTRNLEYINIPEDKKTLGQYNKSGTQTAVTVDLICKDYTAVGADPDNKAEFEKFQTGYNFKKAGYGDTRPTAGDDTLQWFLLRPNMRLKMLSAIYCAKPGADTGRMMMSYPQTGVAIDRQTEELLIPMRMYMGAGVIDKQNLIILNDIQGAGFVSGHGANVCMSMNEKYEGYTAPDLDADDDEYSSGHDLILCAKLKKTPWTDLINDPVFRFCQSFKPAGSTLTSKPPYHDIVMALTESPLNPNTDELQDMPIVPYAGAMWNKDRNKVQSNNGHLEGLDDPRYCDRLEQRQRCHVRQWQADMTTSTL